MREVVIASAVRTPIGSFGGALTGVPAVELGAIAAKAAMERAGIKPEQVDQAIIGNVISAGLGQNVGRQVLIRAGIPQEKPAFSLNIVCGSGLRAVSLAASIIKAGDAEIILAGGTENMSAAPYIMRNHRYGNRMGNDTIVDSMINDGLWDAFNDYHMGVTAENVAKKYNITREEQDAFALRSQQRAQAAIEGGKFKEEIVPVAIPQKKGDPKIFDTDEFPRFGTTIEGLQKLRPAFIKDGTVTAGNASGINDGAAMMIVCSKDKAQELGLPILATIRGYGTEGVDPTIMGIGPVPSSQAALKMAGLAVEDMDLVEANEAFAAQAIAVTRDLNLDPEKTNVNGGAIAIGHPVGASGARILVTLLHEMKRRNSKYGLATLCIGGGMGTALVVEK